MVTRPRRYNDGALAPTDLCSSSPSLRREGGSSSAGQAGRQVRLAFSGDVGRANLPIIRDPQEMPPVDYLIMESTYGDRLHEKNSEVELLDLIKETVARRGCLIIPLLPSAEPKT